MKTKMNFKYVMLACAALAVGFTSCSKDDGNDTEIPQEGAKTFMSITLKQDVASTRYLTENEARPEESAIKRARVYVFSSVKVLEQVQDLDVDGVTGIANATFETTVGTHYFVATANEPAGITVPLGTGLYEMSTILNGIEENKFASYTTDGEFFMTSGVDANTYRDIETASRNIIASEKADAKTNNPVIVKIGRAMAKLSFTFEKSAVNYKPSVEEVGGEISEVKYCVTNNTTAMYYMPHFTNQLFVTPFYQAYNDVFAPTDYWPALHADQTTDPHPYEAASPSSKDKMDHANYMMENSNEFPTYGNATIVSVQAKFTPKAVEDGGALTNGTFYRIKNIDNNTYLGKTINAGTADEKVIPLFFSTEALADAYATDPTKGNFTAKGTDYKVDTYTDGTCYYIIPVRDRSKTSAACYDVIRNHYFDMAIQNVTGCGYPVPGGDDETDPKDPLDPKPYFVDVTIDVLPWVKINQAEDLDVRP